MLMHFYWLANISLMVNNLKLTSHVLPIYANVSDVAADNVDSHVTSLRKHIEFHNIIETITMKLYFI